MIAPAGVAYAPRFACECTRQREDLAVLVERERGAAFAGRGRASPTGIPPCDPRSTSPDAASARASHAATTSSAYSVVFMPNPPPTSPTRTRTLSVSMPSTSLVELVAHAGGRLASSTRSVMRLAARHRSSRAWRAARSVAGATRWLTRSSVTHVRGRGDRQRRRFRVAVLRRRTRRCRSASGHTSGASFAMASASVDHHRQRLVAHVERFRRVARLVAGLGDHRRDRLADEAHRVDREGVLRRRRRGRTVRALEVGGLHERLHAGLRELRTGDDRDHARHRLRGGGIERRRSARARAASARTRGSPARAARSCPRTGRGRSGGFRLRRGERPCRCRSGRSGSGRSSCRFALTCGRAASDSSYPLA